MTVRIASTSFLLRAPVLTAVLLGPASFAAPFPAPFVAAGDDPALDLARAHGKDSQRAVRACSQYAFGWLAHADPVTGLLPRTLEQRFWNAQDCAADNFPFLALTADLTGHPTLETAVRGILEKERALTCRVGALPDDYDFATRSFRSATVDLDHVVFGASEYAKDGLMPWTEWAGPGPWLDRMQELVRGVFEHGPSKAGGLPSDSVEVIGEMLQTCSRLFFTTGDPTYRDFAFRMADHFLLERDLLDADSLSLRDHGCEILGGLSEAYVVAAEVDPGRRERYRPKLHRILDRILECGRTPEGLLFDAFDPRSGARRGQGVSDGFGYVFDAFLTVADLDGVERYREAVAFALANLRRITCKGTPGMGGADGHADSIEGALTLLQHLPDTSAARWIDQEMDALLAFQHPDGVIEGWYGDGNTARTAWMWALAKTLGVHADPWRSDLELGASRDADGTLVVSLRTDWPYRGRLVFDEARHREILHLPVDYARINEFPEWWTYERAARYELHVDGQEARTIEGKELASVPVALAAGKDTVLRVRPLDHGPARASRYRSGEPAAGLAWQRELRRELGDLLHLDASRPEIPLELRTEEVVEDGDLVRETLTFASTSKTRVTARLERRRDLSGRAPAVVAIHGHGGNRDVVFDETSIYRGFARALAERGTVVIAVDVGQHQVREADRTLMGERLQDLLRCVDVLETRGDVDPARIGCAGLSLGGEMAMWLGAMDPRIAATVSCGFLTTMDHMERHHCMCWKFDGLRELVDYADLYAMVAPRALQCQNGLREGPRDFSVTLARRAMQEIDVAYRDFGAAGEAELDVHPEGHVVDLPALLRFFDQHLGGR